ncbi:Ribonuclease P protein component 4 [Gracilariopsis chorda]|uniref:Ribonuclease P protein component 4 n=1 Tax=Gracilariopsis chorda TaxID=448386 RepID=A0A2V3IJP4_9FLOR|nr:Ribonuclease P protein component 4 [Gracilariopsis chorda]|eukprot:PXF42268.1 Ribonuclease P protein component 4 [Gracilariopsis chorda]
MTRKRFDKAGAKKKKIPREEDAALRLTHLIAASAILSENAPSVSRFYAHASKQICRRVNMTLDSVTVKRLFCKKCNTCLIPGVGTPQPTYRIASRRERHLVIKCGRCGVLKRYLARSPAQESKRKRKDKVLDTERDSDSAGYDAMEEDSRGRVRGPIGRTSAAPAANQGRNSWSGWASQKCMMQ